MSYLTSPAFALFVGCTYVVIISAIFGSWHAWNDFVRWGPPLTYFGTKIESQNTFYGILVAYFFHQLVNNWINNVTYAWIINSVQDPKCMEVGYTRRSTLLLVNLFSLYSQVDVLLLIGGATSQISFFAAISVANIVSATIVNWAHLQKKKNSKSDESDGLSGLIMY